MQQEPKLPQKNPTLTGVQALNIGANIVHKAISTRVPRDEGSESIPPVDKHELMIAYLLREKFGPNYIDTPENRAQLDIPNS